MLAQRLHAVMTVLAQTHRLVVIHCNRGFPCAGCVARFTVVRRINVRCMLPNVGAAIVAGDATADDLCMIHSYNRLPDRAFAVASAAGAACRNMVFGLAGCSFAVMASTAITNDLRMVDPDLGHEFDRVMAFLTHVTGTNVLSRFPGGWKVCAVMA